MTFLPRFPSPPRSPAFQTFVLFVKSVFIGHFVSTHVGCFAGTEGPSMLPTINVRGVRVYIDNTFTKGRGIKVGDVVDFHHPMVQGVGGIKRVMGMPGDFVVKDGGEGKGKMMIQVRHLCLEDSGPRRNTD